MSEERPADGLDVLLIEDNPGDARLIQEMLRGAGELLRRVEGGSSTASSSTASSSTTDSSTAGSPRVRHETSLSSGLERLAESDAEEGNDVDVVLLDLGLPESTGLDTLAAVLEATEFVPVVVLTGLRDEAVGVEAIQRGAQDYLVKDEVTSDLLVRSIHHAVERNAQERERIRQLEQLEALNRLNRISQDITHAVITTSTREELERAVCERLVESDAYRFAWIGDADRTSDRVRPRVFAGATDGALDDLTAPDAVDVGQGPTERAVRTGEVEVRRSLEAGSALEPWRAAAVERGYRSVAAAPIVFEGFVYGVLTVYADSPGAFSGPETQILSRLGDVIGHAITAIERKDALVNDTVLELQFQVEGVAEELVALTADGAGSIEFENLVRTDDALLVYGRADGIPEEAFRDAADRTSGIDDVRVLSPGAAEYEFEIVTGAAGPLSDAVATHGGHISTGTIRDGTFHVVFEFPTGRDKRQLIDLVESHCEGAAFHAQRTVQRRDRDVSNVNSVLRDGLTDKQRTALETAHHAGFFEWPRTSNGQELADRFGVSPATFTQHLRAAERRFFDAVFGEERTDGRTEPSAWRSSEVDADDE